MKSDSAEFLIKTNKDVDSWMDSFYTDGHKADFRSHCQWAWQEQERRHNAAEDYLIAALEGLIKFGARATDCPAHLHVANHPIAIAHAAINKAKGLTQ